MEVDPETNLIMSEAEALKKLEKHLNVPLKAIRWVHDRGYLEISKQVVSLHLQGLSVSELPDFITKFEKLREINLSAFYLDDDGIKPENQIQAIDLTFLQDLKHFERLFLSNNRLTTLDLTPLKSCPNLKKIHLYSNQLKEIDLRPLAQCSLLQLLDLSNNELQTIDLTPLANCKDFEDLMLDSNQLEAIDLTPLRSLNKLNLLHLSSNNITQIDYAPLIGLTKLEYFLIDKKVKPKDSRQSESFFFKNDKMSC